MKACIYEADDIVPLDLVIANAGVFEAVTGVDALDDLEKAAYAIADVNIHGVMNTVLPAIACMRNRKQGQIAITSSICAHAPFLPISPTYAGV
jgi:NADP-dependent 3-hydroxy acid dehydrogenase YdfG